MNIAIAGYVNGFDLVTVQIKDEAGELLECNHANAEVEDMEFAKSSWWADAHMYVNDDSEIIPTLVCDKDNCRAWQDQDGTWNPE